MNEKLLSFFANFNLNLTGKYPKHLTHLYADYIELVALFSNGNYLTRDIIEDRFKDEGILRQVKDYLDISEIDDEDRANENDKTESWINDIFQIISERVILFTNDYPFLLDSRGFIIKEQASERQQLYLFLLISSNLSLFRLFEPDLTSEFEDVCFYSLKNYLPQKAIVKSFGKNSEYTGTAKSKMRALAEEMNISIDETFLEKISDLGNQERGLDLIGWLPFNDRVPNFISVLAQCACGKEWYLKLGETKRYNRYYKFYLQEPIHALFIPYALTNYQNTDFHQGDEFGSDVLVFERFRILSTIDDTDFFKKMDSSLLVLKCLESQEDIV